MKKNEKKSIFTYLWGKDLTQPIFAHPQLQILPKIFSIFMHSFIFHPKINKKFQPEGIQLNQKKGRRGPNNPIKY